MTKKASVMVLKFIISTIIAVLVFYFLMYKACSFVPFIHDKAEKTIADIDKTIQSLDHGTSLMREIIVLDEKKGLLFFNNNSNEIKIHTTTLSRATVANPYGGSVVQASDKHLYYFVRPLDCNLNQPCFCYCDEIVELSKEKCNFQLACKRAKMVCKNYDLNFTFQQDKEGFFNDSLINFVGSSNTRLVFEGGFLLSPKYTLIDTKINRMPLVFQKRGDVIHLCSKDADCDPSDRTQKINDLLSVTC